MIYEKTELNFLERDCELQFGEKDGARIFRRASKLYAELVVTTDYKNNPLLERQLKGLVYPVIAYYKTLLAEGYRESNALGLVRTETEKAAKKQRRDPARAAAQAFSVSCLPPQHQKFYGIQVSCRGMALHRTENKGRQDRVSGEAVPVLRRDA